MGTGLNITHDFASPVGVKVRAIAEITSFEKNRLTFSVKVRLGSHNCKGQGWPPDSASESESLMMMRSGRDRAGDNGRDRVRAVVRARPLFGCLGARM